LAGPASQPSAADHVRKPGKEMYVELHTSSAFSFLDGASLPEVLVEQA
jgi:hypothetical protein